ncbi:class I SAM-dependent methyltransferase [Kitasatospora sp. P5_F3]
MAGWVDRPVWSFTRSTETCRLSGRTLTWRQVDFSPIGLEQLRTAAASQGVADRVRTEAHDVRTRLPLADASVDAVFAHMLLCMALSTGEIHTLVTEVHRVLRPGGVFVYTVRHTDDAHYGAGTAHGDDIWEHSGFAVHQACRPPVRGSAP